MMEINHKNILHCYEYLATSHNYYLVLQLCNQGDFEHYMKVKHIKKFEEKDALYFLKQIFNGFVELRKHCIIHRDFKLANLFVHDERLIIGDFGFAKKGFLLAKTMLGSPVTMAPEILFAKDENIEYSSKVDLWSVGVVFYQMLFGQAPFDVSSIDKLKTSIK